ncbi:MAG: tetratricopeptide repeat protein [Leptolyngbyaceae cyanobacterium SL_7_1]|nr:tetratricopeptide repeat protein [Leptolyngbyaceae cyanobacterium SL_7_1]
MKMVYQVAVWSVVLMSVPMAVLAQSPTEAQVAEAQQFYQDGVEEIEDGDYPEAIEELTNAITADPTYAPAYTYRGVAHTTLGNEDEGLADLNQAIQLDPNATVAYFIVALFITTLSSCSKHWQILIGQSPLTQSMAQPICTEESCKLSWAIAPVPCKI